MNIMVTIPDLQAQQTFGRVLLFAQYCSTTYVGKQVLQTIIMATCMIILKAEHIYNDSKVGRCFLTT